VRACWLFWLLGLSRAPPGPRAAMWAGLVGPVGSLRGGAFCGGHRGNGAGLAGRRGRVVRGLLCRRMGGGARGARMICRREAVLALRRCGVGALVSGGGWCEGETGVRCGAERGAGRGWLAPGAAREG
jgi:hypothetical protein